jgi:mRNA interferase MazF
MKRGEIRWYTFLPPDKKRPVLILKRDSVLEYLGEATIVPITTTARNIPSEGYLSRADGVPQDWALNCDHLQTVSKKKIGQLIKSLPQSKMMDVGLAIRFALNI